MPNIPHEYDPPWARACPRCDDKRYIGEQDAEGCWHRHPCPRCNPDDQFGEGET